MDLSVQYTVRQVLANGSELSCRPDSVGPATHQRCYHPRGRFEDAPSEPNSSSEGLGDCLVLGGFFSLALLSVEMIIGFGVRYAADSVCFER